MSLDKEKAEKVRNIGIVAHIDAGKTTTTEKFLFQTGRIWKSGTTHEGDTQMDYLEAERKRGITITSAATTISWNNHQINLIDTPGHIDFTAEVERSLRVLDGAVLIIDSQAGVEPQTETVWRQTERYENPRLIFFNKMDKIGADFYYSLKTIEEKLGANTLILQIPIGSENNLEGIVDIVTEKAYSFDRDLKEEYKEIDVPFNLISEVSKFKVELLDKITLFDDDLLTKYMNGENLTTLEIKYLIRKATLSTKVFPIFCGTAFKNIGIKFLLDGIIDYLPSPLDLKNKFSYMTN
ncbi:MAG TPA: GTP-binding protein, partial [Mycoplasmatales bacterium]|nr:GTP-binding protein [Mycoplasmatales bacterium]